MATRATHASRPWGPREKHPVFHAPENTYPIQPSSSFTVIHEWFRLGGVGRRGFAQRVAAAKTIGEKSLQGDLFLLDETGLRQMPRAQHVQHRTNAARG